MVTPNSTQYELIAQLRLAIGFLGEQGPSKWWPSNFFGAGSDAFLRPVFSRTVSLARYHGVVQAAARVHDEHVGVGRAFHVFRLPEDIEFGIQSLFQNGLLAPFPEPFDRPAALSMLQRAGVVLQLTGEGPVRVGDSRSLRDSDIWSVVADHYARAFDREIRVYPYFAELR